MKKVRIKSDAIKGRGVYAAEKIRRGDVLEICQLIVLPIAEVSGILERYVFDFSTKKVALALGNGSLYNHSHHPNAKCWMDTTKKVLIIKALRPILPLEEIVINYGYSKKDRLRFNLV